eukprot:Blabericola_migrator_1__80@NODE_101_length_14318_cov_135_243281_g28_i1_p2_GENE_NODE_101_length_14318_cov_135_243281_g28_i1NODE_101_length_14318_cov_135_243281_g28_i1_p2_ORF_typecomplete_len721_score167_76COG6/PF06419_11/5_3e50Sec3_C/PF09763_9/0_0015_NODE_101_length_14318_cov_135_243281_g28_i170549216
MLTLLCQTLGDSNKEFDDSILPAQVACRLVIQRRKIQQAGQVIDCFESFGQSVLDIADRLKNAKEQCQEASQNIDLNNYSNAPLERVAQLQAARETVRQQLTAAVDLKELVLADPDEVGLIKVDVQPALASRYLFVVRNLMKKKENLLKLLTYADQNGELKLPLSECLKIVPSEIPAGTHPLLIELDDLLELAIERLFSSAQQCCIQLVSSLFTADEAAQNLADEMFSVDLVTQAHENPIPDVSTEVSETQSAEESVLNFYRTIFLLQSRPRYLRQSIKALAGMRHRLLKLKFLQTLQLGTIIIDAKDEPMTIDKSSLTSTNRSDSGIHGKQRLPPLRATDVSPTEFFGSVLSWVYQRVLEESEFVTHFFKSLDNTKLAFEETPYDDDPDGNFTDPWDFLDFTTREGLLPQLETALKPYCPFLDRQQQRRDPPSISSLFEIIYILDFYIDTVSKILSPDSRVVDNRPMPHLVVFLVDLREGFYKTMKVLLEDQAVMLNEYISDEALSPTMRIPPFVLRAVKLFQSLALVYDQHVLYLTSIGATDEDMATDEKVQEFNDILESIFNPVINVARRIAAQLSEDKASIYVLNCYSYMLASLKGIKAAEKCFPIYTVLTSLTEDALKAIIDLQALAILKRVGLTDVKSSEDLVPVVQKLYTFASSATKFSLISRISSNSLEQRAARETMDKICAAYATALGDNTQSTLPSPSNIKALLMSDVLQ